MRSVIFGKNDYLEAQPASIRGAAVAVPGGLARSIAEESAADVSITTQRHNRDSLKAPVLAAEFSSALQNAPKQVQRERPVTRTALHERGDARQRVSRNREDKTALDVDNAPRAFPH